MVAGIGNIAELDSLPEQGLDQSSILAFVENSLNKNRWQNRDHNAGRVFAVPDELATQVRQLSEDTANVTLSSPFLSNTFYSLEDQLGSVTLDLLSHPNPSKGGFLTAFSTTAGIIEALHNERRRYEELQGKGRNPVVLAPITANVAVKKALDLTGIGTENMVLYDLDQNFQPDINSLEEVTARIRGEGRDMLAVIAVAGDTEHGVIHDVSNLATLKTQGDYTPGFVVDAAFGWTFLVDNKERRATTLDNRNVDAVVLDFHKWAVPFNHGMVLFQDGDKRKYSLFEEERSTYEQQEWNFPYSREHFLRSRMSGTRLTQGAAAIPTALATLLKYGRAGLAETNRRITELAQEFATYLKVSDDFELITEPETGVVSFTLKQGNNYEFMERFNQGTGPTLGYSGTVRCRTREELTLPTDKRDGFWIHFMPYSTQKTVDTYIDRLNTTRG